MASEVPELPESEASASNDFAAIVRDEAAYLRQQFTVESVIRMHAQFLVYHDAKLRVTWGLAWRATFGHLSYYLIGGSACGYLLAPRGSKWARLLLGTGILGSGILLWAWRSYNRLGRPIVDPSFQIEETPPEETIDLTSRLGYFLDEASGAELGQTELVVEKAVSFQGHFQLLEDDKGPSSSVYISLPPDIFLRYLVVEPGEFDADIVCSLYVDDYWASDYDAVSYVWGEEDDGADTITVNGHAVDIRKNLSTVLRYLRYKNKQRTLWIDAICIDQNNLVERNAQVAAMSEIYSHAESVLVFLGEEELQVSELFDFCRKIENAVRIDDVLESVDIPVLLQLFWPLLDRPWWSRVWVVQEFAYARRDPVLICGRQKLKSGAFWKGLEVLRERMVADLYFKSEKSQEISPSLLERLSNSPSEHWHMLQMRRSLFNWRSMYYPSLYRISDILKITRLHKATDPRDHIFAVHSLMMEPFRVVFTPDYNQSIAMTYTRMASFLLCIQPWPDIYNSFALDNDDGLPSWVPNFSRGFGHGFHGQFWSRPATTGIFGEIDCYVTAGILASRGIDFGEVTIIADLINTEMPIGNPRGEPLSTKSEIFEMYHYIDENMGRIYSRRPDEEDPVNMFYRLLADDFNFNPNHTPFITREEVVEFMVNFSEKMDYRHYLSTKVLGRDFFAKNDPEALESADEILENMKTLFRALRLRKQATLRLEELERAERLEHKVKDKRLKASQIEQELKNDYTENLRSAKELSKELEEFEKSMASMIIKSNHRIWGEAILGCAMIETDSGLFGITKQAVQQGDRLISLNGIPSLFVVRATDRAKEYSIVGRIMVREKIGDKMKQGVEEGAFVERQMFFR